MKTVTIPTCANPFVVIVNGIKYTYPAGATVEVPDDVAEVIEQHEEAKPEPAPVLPPFATVPSEGGAGGLEVITLTTEINSVGGAFSSEESTVLTKAYEKGNPVIIKGKLNLGTMAFPTFAGVAMVGYAESSNGTDAPMFGISLGSIVVQIVFMNNMWVFVAAPM